MPLGYLNQFSLLSATQVFWQYLWEYGVHSNNLSSDLMIFFLLFKLLFDCKVVLLREIRKLINLESANFKLDPELSPLNDHTLIPCRTIKNFFFHFTQRSEWIEEYKNGKEKKEEKMGMSTITQQSNHQRKERKTSQNQILRLKSLPLRKKKGL